MYGIYAGTVPIRGPSTDPGLGYGALHNNFQSQMGDDNMRNTFRTIIAAITGAVALLGLTLATSTASAAESNIYRPTINTTGITYDPQTGIMTATIQSSGAVKAGYTHVSVRYHSRHIADVTLAANVNSYKYLGTANGDDYTLRLKLTDQTRSKASNVHIQVHMSKTRTGSYEELMNSDYVTATAIDANGNSSQHLTYNVPAIGETTEQTQQIDTIAQTGAAIAPYAIAVILLTAAGTAILTTRRHRTNQ